MKYLRLAILLGCGCAGRVPNGDTVLTYEYKGREVSRAELQKLDDAALQKAQP